MTSHVLLALLVILLATAVCGRLASKVGQPRVVGEMVAGVLLGPSLFGLLFPAGQRALFPAEIRSVLYLLSMLGLILFMFLVGAGIRSETVNRRLLRGATIVGTAGVALPFALGFGTAWLLAGQISEPGTPRFQVAFLLGAALSVTAFPTLARIIDERRMGDSPLGSMTLLAASIDDAVAWILLAVIAALRTGGSAGQVLLTLLGGGTFVFVMLTVGRRALTGLARHVDRRGDLTPGSLAVILLFVLGSAMITDLFGIHYAFGAFIAGLALPKSTLLRDRLRHKLMDLNVGLLLPIFFVYTGLSTELAGFSDGGAVIPLMLIMIVAFAGKYLGCAVAARRQGYPWRHASAIGGLMNARGLMVLIFINIARDYGIITTDLFTILVLVAVVSTAAAMPIYRLSLPGPIEDIERDRGAHQPGQAHPEHPGAMPSRTAPARS